MSTMLLIGRKPMVRSFVFNQSGDSVTFTPLIVRPLYLGAASLAFTVTFTAPSFGAAANFASNSSTEGSVSSPPILLALK